MEPVAAFPEALSGTENPNEPPSNRRSRPRQRVVIGALIVFKTSNCTMGCQILDVSDTGAKLLPADAAQCPDEFTLKPRVGPTRTCEVVWRHGTMVGVRYLDIRPNDQPTGAAARGGSVHPLPIEGQALADELRKKILEALRLAYELRPRQWPEPEGLNEVKELLQRAFDIMRDLEEPSHGPGNALSR